jgi:hypothetical protein
MSDDLSLIKEEIQRVKERNKRVELEKAWETSKTRSISIFVMTYIVMCCVFYFIFPNEFITNALTNAIVPTCGFALSTIALPKVKKWWMKKFGN